MNLFIQNAPLLSFLHLTLNLQNETILGVIRLVSTKLGDLRFRNCATCPAFFSTLVPLLAACTNLEHLSFIDLRQTELISLSLPHAYRLKSLEPSPPLTLLSLFTRLEVVDVRLLSPNDVLPILPRLYSLYIASPLPIPDIGYILQNAFLSGLRLNQIGIGIPHITKTQAMHFEKLLHDLESFGVEYVLLDNMNRSLPRIHSIREKFTWLTLVTNRGAPISLVDQRYRDNLINEK